MATKAQLQREHPADDLVDVIRRFLTACRQPVLIEDGERPIPLVAGRYNLESRGVGCVLHAWGEQGNLVRRIVQAGSGQQGRLELRTASFGKREIRIAIVDEANRRGTIQRDAGQARFHEFLRRILFRDYRPWTLVQLTSSPDLEHSFSPSYVRGVLRRGHEAWAVIGAPPGASAAANDQILSFGLIWFDHLRSRAQDHLLAGLRIFVPQGRARTTANRLAWLNPAVLRTELIEFDGAGNVSPFDKQDYGNLATELRPCLPETFPQEPVAGWLRELLKIDGVETVQRPDGLLSLRVRGTPFATAGRGVMTYGLNQQTPVGPAGVDPALQLARGLARFRSHNPLDPRNAFYRGHPETWLESQVRRHVDVIEDGLGQRPLYGQVPTVAGPDRGIIDLLGCDRQRRLAVLELKASEDIHLPLQALDYWMRVKWHLDRGEFTASGYFPHIELAERPPRLILVAPAMDFHPSTETILKYLAPNINVERVGVGADWRREVQVVFRQTGSARLA
ncbi:MAG: hypothetical protein O2968_17065 [Acidobacteria bacterium]|nr:hypothetical protein [Acidobacteriota bacterium]